MVLFVVLTRSSVTMSNVLIVYYSFAIHLQRIGNEVSIKKHFIFSSRRS